MPREHADWKAVYEAERDTTPARSAKTVVYLVMECGWEYNDSFYEATTAGITLKAFRIRERAIEYAQWLQHEGKLHHWQIVERTLEEGEG
jgi:hypothetical protein